MDNVGSYTKKVIEHFQSPHNYGRIKNPDGVGKAGNIICGDMMQLYIKVGRDKKGREIIEDIKFETLGCPAAISTSSVVTDLTKGKTFQQALRINSNKVVKSLGGLPAIKHHCSLLAISALFEAIYGYLSKNKKEIPEKLQKRHQRIEKERKEIKKEIQKVTKTK